MIDKNLMDHDNSLQTKLYNTLLGLLIVILLCLSPNKGYCFDYQIQYDTTTQELTTPRVALAYVTSWTKGLPDPTYLTHINYAFGKVNAAFNGIEVSNPGKLRSIVALKKEYPELRICLSVGGWGSGGFSEMAATKENRDDFAADCAAKIREFQLDGIDIDWEYPTSSSAKISSSPNDTRNFTLLMQAIRTAIGSSKLLTLASSAGAGFIDFRAIDPFIDFVNIMAYDMSGAPQHHSGLYRSSMSAHLTADEAVQRHENAGVPPEKLVLGMPFYGHGRDSLPYYVNYKDIVKLKGYEHHWDDTAKSPYLTDTNGRVVLNYENPASIAIKCQYIRSHGLLGGMYWDYDGDTPDGILRKTVYEQLGLKRPVDSTGSNSPDTTTKFSVLAFYSADFDPAHISFAHEANKWFSAAGSRFYFKYDSTKDWDLLNDSNYMAKYQVVLFLDKVPPASIHQGFEQYMRGGGGFVGFHVTAYNDQKHAWDWYYNDFLGCGLFEGNTWRPTSAILKVDQPQHPVNQFVPALFESAPNEWYKWEKDLRSNKDIDVLLSIDPSSFPLGTGPKPFEIWHEGDYPVVWTNKNYRMLYVNMGHNDMDYEHKYGSDNGTLSHTFSSEPECRMILNALFWLGAGTDLPSLPVITDSLPALAGKSL